MDISATLQEIQSWPLEDRIELVQRAWDSIEESDWTPELTDDQKAELDRRVEAFKANPNEAITWESIVAHVRRER